MHLNAFYDLQKHTYSDAMIQPVHQNDEFRAFCDMVDRHHILHGTKDVFIGDRGYALITTWHMSWKKVSISSSAQKTFILKDLLETLIFRIQIYFFCL